MYVCRFPEVAEMKSVWWFDIIGNIEKRFLSPETTYAAFLVFKLIEGARGLEVANAGVKFVEDEANKLSKKKFDLQWFTFNQRRILMERLRYKELMDGWRWILEASFFKMDMKERWRHGCMIRCPG